MGKPLVGKRQKGHVTRRIKAASALDEYAKIALFIRGAKTSQRVLDVLRDLCALKKPHSKMFSRKNAILPFQDETALETLCSRNNASVFAMGTHNKKRPHNLIFGRLFDAQVLDMMEFGVINYTSMRDVTRESGAKPRILGSKPLMVFQGSEFQQSHDTEWGKVKSLLLDIFRGDEIEMLDLSSVDNSIVVTALPDEKIAIRCYHVAYTMEKTETKAPKIKLLETGPRLDLKMRRSKLASLDLMKRAMKQPKLVNVPKKRKNIERDVMGSKLGRVHMKKQDFSKLVTRSRFKGLKRGHKAGNDDAASASPGKQSNQCGDE